MASLFWTLLTAPENSRISVDSSTMSAGCSLQSITSCELSTLEERDGQSSDHEQGGCHQTKEVLAAPSSQWLYTQDASGRPESTIPILHPPKICCFRDWPHK